MKPKNRCVAKDKSLGIVSGFLMSVLDELEKHNILDITWNERRRVFEVSEVTDPYYTMFLTPEQLIALGTELVIMGTGRIVKM